MKQLHNILDKYNDIKNSYTELVLATVVEVYGSSYRRPGARMLIEPNGNWTGGVSGGCLEGDLLKKAKKVLLDGKDLMVRYDTSQDDPYQIGVGLGCRGIIDIHLSKLDTSNSNNPLEKLQSRIHSRKKSIFLLYCNGKNNKSGEAFHQLEDIRNNEALHEDPEADKAIKEEVSLRYKNGQSGLFTFKLASRKTLKVFVEIFTPKALIYIAGQEYDTIALLHICRQLAWETRLICHPTKITKEQLALVDQIIPFKNLEAVIRDADSYAALIIMSHNYTDDLYALKHSINSPVSYIGLLGPKDRGDRLLDELNKEELFKNEAIRAKLHFPTGLDIGANEPEEIALSIVTEILATRRNRAGGKLKKRQAPIHDRTDYQ